MSHSRVARATSRRTRVRRARIAYVQPLSRLARRALRALLAAPLAVRILVGAVVIFAVWLVLNWGYQVLRKPTELFFPVSDALAKTPPETWRRYGLLFREHSTAVTPPELLPALAQAEGGANPVARTYSRPCPPAEPFERYQPRAPPPAPH